MAFPRRPRIPPLRRAARRRPRSDRPDRPPHRVGKHLRAARTRRLPRISRWRQRRRQGGRLSRRRRLADLQRPPRVEERRRRATRKASRDPAARSSGRVLWPADAGVHHPGSSSPPSLGTQREIEATVRAEWIESARMRLAKKAKIAPEAVDASLLTDEEVLPRRCEGDQIHFHLFRDIVKNIRANWLMTPRSDLGGATPREIAFAGRDHASRDMNDRMLQWAEFHHCPPGLARSSQAFRFAPFGTHELVKYYDLVRELLWSTWFRLVELSEAPNPKDRPEAMTLGDFLTTEIPRQEAYLEAWLDAPDPEMHGRPPRGYIERERARIPETVSKSEAIHDPDCPCCQMMAELPGPMFCGLDSMQLRRGLRLRHHPSHQGRVGRTAARICRGEPPLGRGKSRTRTARRFVRVEERSRLDAQLRQRRWRRCAARHPRLRHRRPLGRAQRTPA